MHEAQRMPCSFVMLAGRSVASQKLRQLNVIKVVKYLSERSILLKKKNKIKKSSIEQI